MLLFSDEILMKTKMWEKVNADYLKAKAEKEEREKQEAEEAAKEVPDSWLIFVVVSNASDLFKTCSVSLGTGNQKENSKKCRISERQEER